MGIKRYKNAIRRSRANKGKPVFALLSCNEFPIKVYYAGDLTRIENCHLLEAILIKETANFSDETQIVVLFEEDIKPATAEFIQKFDNKVQFQQVPSRSAGTFVDYIWQNLYRNHGWFSKKARNLYKREYRRLFAQIDEMNVDSVHFINSALYERVEEIALCKTRTFFHHIPELFYRQLADVFITNPDKLQKVAEEYDEIVEYDIDFAHGIWENEPASGIYIKPSNIKVTTDTDSIRLQMNLRITIPERNGQNNTIRPDSMFLIGSTLHGKVFEYPMEMAQTKSGYGITVTFPKKDISGWYTNNLPMLSFETTWGRIKVPILTAAKSGEKAYGTDTDKAFVIRQDYRHLRIIIREEMVTDRASEKIKLAAAFALHVVTPWHSPVVMYEKYCMNYEESASILFEKLIDMGYTNLKYILNRDSFARKGINEKYLKHIADQHSFSHYYNLFAAKSIIASEAIGHSLEKGSSSGLFKNFVVDGSKNYVFLQHGVMYMVALSSEQRNFFNKAEGKGKQRVVVSSHLEAEHFTNSTDYQPEDMYISGLIKFDRSVLDKDADRIMVMLTWRPWEFVLGTNNIKGTAYYKMLKRIVDAVPEKLKEKLIVMPHPLLARQASLDKEDDVWKYYMPDVKYDDILKKTKLLITDYSSISYDAFYRGSNIIFDWEEKDQCMKEYGENGRLMLTEELAFGDICYNNSEMTDRIARAYAEGQSSEYQERYSRLVEFHDGRNSERFIEMAKKDGIL